MQSFNTDIQLFNTLFSKYQKRFIHFAVSYVCDISVAEDIVMESFLYYWENRFSIDKDANLPAYILTVIKNRSLNYLRNQAIHAKAEDHIRLHQDRVLQANLISLEACDPQELFSSEAEGIVKDALAKLPELTREIFVKSRFENRSYKEIALNFNISERTVESHISKALKVLRLALKDYLPALLIWLSHGI
ncbi:RNA polymerase sigma-70 factor [uncultured Bacteroides sp.]|uniref:RNA polymerase sigma-70 factor n=1 Tax=uncultured Bacteroides sp. TaxID=162156 RepID=UPI002AA7F4FB|nr:RNA polymerase sigma-70 factor [uncultured Bacteroides sp.]